MHWNGSQANVPVPSKHMHDFPPGKKPGMLSSNSFNIGQRNYLDLLDLEK